MAPANRERKQKTAGAKDEGVVFWTVPASAVKPRQPAAPKSTWEQFGEAVGHIRKVCEDYTRGLKNVLGELPAPSESPSPAETLPAEQLIETDVYRTLGSQETQSKDEWLEQAKKAHPKRRSETNRAWVGQAALCRDAGRPESGCMAGLENARAWLVSQVQRADWREAKAEQLGEVAAWLRRTLH